MEVADDEASPVLGHGDVAHARFVHEEHRRRLKDGERVDHRDPLVVGESADEILDGLGGERGQLALTERLRGQHALGVLAFATAPEFHLDTRDEFLQRAVDSVHHRLAGVDARLFSLLLGQLGSARRVDLHRDTVRASGRRHERRSRADLYNSRIRLLDGTETSLRTVANLTETRSYSTIESVDGKRIVRVTAELDEAINTPGEVFSVIETELLPALEETYRGLTYSKAGKGVDQDRDLGALYGLGVIAMLIIYVMIASLLRSYAQPLVIMTAVPFGAAGALIGHFILGFNISFISMFGIIALSGVVVNDSLILIDRYNRYRRETDMDAAEAILAAARRRFRPIILTTVTTALGLTPMLFETSIQAQFLIPMAVSLASGIVFASIIILFLVPALVLIEDDLGMRTG